MSGARALRPVTALVWCAGALGDTLLAYPALAALRAWAPECRVTAIGHPSFLVLAQRAGLVDLVLSADGIRASRLFAGDIGSDCEVPDLAVIWSTAYAHLAAVLQRAGAHTLIGAPAHPLDRRHQSRYLLDSLTELGVSRVLRPAPVPPLAALAPGTASLLGSPHDPPMLLHPGAGARWKRWPLAHYQALAEGLRAAGIVVRWSFGPADQDLREALLDHPSCRAEVWPDLDVDTFAALLGRCSALVSADTGVAHLAALLRVPQVTLFGPTDARRWRPLSRRAVVLRARGACDDQWPAPGDRTGHGPLPRLCLWPEIDPCRCLVALPPDEVLLACLSLVHAGNSRPEMRSPERPTEP